MAARSQSDTRAMVKAACENLRGRKMYVKSDDVAEEMAVENTRGRRSNIGQALRELSESEPWIELWSEGCTANLFRLEGKDD